VTQFLVPVLLALVAGADAPPPAPPAPAPAVPAATAAAPRGRIRGEVGVSRRFPITGAVVAAVREDDLSTVFLTTTDSIGVFLFEGIAEGTYRLDVFKDGLQPLRKEGVVVRGPFRTELSLQVPVGAGDEPLVGEQTDAPPPLEEMTPAPGAEVDVTVVAQGGVPIEGARISLRSQDSGADPVRAATQTSGKIVLRRPRPGLYELRIEAPGFLPIHVKRLRLAGVFSSARIFLTPRPYNYPGTPTDLLPDEKPVPPSDLRHPQAPASASAAPAA